MVLRNVPMYQAKIPIRGGGGVIDLSSKENETKMLLAQLIGEALGKVYGPGKRQRQERQQISQVSPILSREGDRAINIRDALAAIQEEQRPTGLGGALDFLNPLAPARGGGSEIERYLTEQTMQQPKQKGGRIVVGDGKTWLVDPQTGEKRDLGIPAPRSKVGKRKISDIINDISKLFTLPEGVIGLETERGVGRTLEDELTRKRGLPTPQRTPLIEGEPIQMPEKIKGRETPITQALETKLPKPTLGRTPRDIRPTRKAKGRSPKPKEYPDAKWSEEHQMWTVVKNGRLMGVK